MKKSIASALTAAIVLGAASTTFAAPTDQEVAELRARIAELERIVSEQNRINAQNAKQRDVEDLDSRVADLEEKSNESKLDDKLSIGGELRYRYWNLHKSSDSSSVQLRILPNFKVDDHFTVKARFTSQFKEFHEGGDAKKDIATNFAYLESKFDNLQVNVGRMPLFSNADRGLLIDDFFNGIQITTGDTTKFGVNLGSYDGDAYIGLEGLFNPSEKLNFGVGYHYSKTQDADKEKSSFITGGVGYNLKEDLEVAGTVSHSTEADSDKTAYNIELNYKESDRNVKGTWDAYAAYRYVPSSAVGAPTYDTFACDKAILAGKKGFEIGGSWVPYKSTLTALSYFHGKGFNGDSDRTFFARASIFF